MAPSRETAVGLPFPAFVAATSVKLPGIFALTTSTAGDFTRCFTTTVRLILCQISGRVTIVPHRMRRAGPLFHSPPECPLDPFPLLVALEAGSRELRPDHTRGGHGHSTGRRGGPLGLRRTPTQPNVTMKRSYYHYRTPPKREAGVMGSPDPSYPEGSASESNSEAQSFVDPAAVEDSLVPTPLMT
ncbi:uncharacterized protein LOC144178110 [Haemaphysalis longicornis]